MFLSVVVNAYNYLYYYRPSSSAEGEMYFDAQIGISVSISREENSFQAVIEQCNLSADAGMAFDSKNNSWIIDNEGKAIHISFPQSVSVDTVEKLNELITFEQYVISGGDNVTE